MLAPMIRTQWFKRNPERIDPDELAAKADQSLALTRNQQERVNTLTSWLEGRKDQNGFGEDFEVTLLAPRPRGDFRFPTTPRGAR